MKKTWRLRIFIMLSVTIIKKNQKLFAPEVESLRDGTTRLLSKEEVLVFQNNAWDDSGGWSDFKGKIDWNLPW